MVPDLPEHGRSGLIEADRFDTIRTETAGE